MSKKFLRVFDFKKVDGKWEKVINRKMLFIMKTQKGIEPDEIVDYLRDMPKEKFNSVLLNSWFNFANENKIKIENKPEDKEKFLSFLDACSLCQKH